MRNFEKRQFMDRVASFSTRASKRGINLLGWEVDESLTFEQQHECLKDRLKYLKAIHPQLTGEDKAISGKHQARICKEISDIRQNLHTAPKDFPNFLLDTIKSDLPDFKWREYVNRAKLNYKKSGGVI